MTTPMMGLGRAGARRPKWAAACVAGIASVAAMGCVGGGRAGGAPPRAVTGPPDMAGVAAFAPGDRALCRRGSGEVALPGRVADIEQGRLIVQYDDGTNEAITPRLCEKQGGPAVVAVPASEPRDGALTQGARVLCRWKGRDREYPGQVGEVRGDRLVIQYDDGDMELIDAGMCRADAGSGLSASSFQTGGRVRCRWKGGATEYPGTIASIEQGELFIHYDDGDQERIRPSLCRPDEGGPTPVSVTPTGGGLSGNYTILSASNPGGGRAYAGQVVLSKPAEAYTLQWSIPGTPPYGGVGIEVDNVLGVGWGTQGQDYGVVVYRIQGGSLQGTWASSSSSGRLGTEDLQGPAGLNGEYRIVRARTPGGGTYTGTVRIAPSGDTHTLQWTLPRESYGGVGIRRGNLLVVGWGSGRGAGAVAYTKGGNRLDGVWATPGGTQLGTEVLERR